MHLGLRQLETFWREHRDDPRLVLATVIATEGSTYRKPGAMMLVGADGGFAGMISGGCLEDDLVKHALKVFADGQPRRVSYDLHDDPELIWGLGLGCGGDVHLLLVRVDRGEGPGILAGMFDSLAARQSCLLGLVTEGEGTEWPTGASALLSSSGAAYGDPALLPTLRARVGQALANGRCEQVRYPSDSGEGGLLLIRVEPPPHVLICGAGPDAVPVAAQVNALGWDCTIVDHRPAYASGKRFPGGTRVVCCRPAQLGAELELEKVDAAVVMTHHLEHDAAYLEQLAPHKPGYVGLLGPAARRRQLLEGLGAGAPTVHGPAGLDIGAELPESIALAIVAEIHARLNGRTGRSLSHGE